MNKKKKFNILIFGCGNIGFRHLQAILKLKLNVNILLYDINKKKYQDYLKKIKKLKFNKDTKSIIFLKELNFNQIDLCIISSTANNRLQQVKQICNCNKILNILIEKIPFQDNYELKNSIKLFKKEKINVWVNCPNRIFKGYNELKKILLGEKFNMIVEGSNWNILSNSIHYLDIFHFLNKSKIKCIKNNLTKPVKSKRDGYKEALGKIRYEYYNNNFLELKSYKDKNLSIIIKIFSNNYLINIYEEFNKICIINKKTKNIIFKKFLIERQSNLTNQIYYNILINRKCGLVKIEDCNIYLNPYLSNISRYFKKNKIKAVPIT